MGTTEGDRSDPTWHRVIEIPEHLTLKRKAARRGGPSPDELVARAQQALDGISSNFDAWIEDTLRVLVEAHATIREHGIDDARAQALYRAAHNVKGLSGTVGFPLAGRVADSLCALIDRVEDRARLPMILVEQHIGSITAIVHERASGEGTAIARTLVERLIAVTSEFMAHETARQTEASAHAADMSGKSAA